MSNRHLFPPFRPHTLFPVNFYACVLPHNKQSAPLSSAKQHPEVSPFQFQRDPLSDRSSINQSRFQYPQDKTVVPASWPPPRSGVHSAHYLFAMVLHDPCTDNTSHQSQPAQQLRVYRPESVSDSSRLHSRRLIHLHPPDSGWQ